MSGARPDVIHIALVEAGLPWPPPDGDSPDDVKVRWCGALAQASKVAAQRLADDGLVSGPLWDESGADLVRESFLGAWWPLAVWWEAACASAFDPLDRAAPDRD